MVVARIVMNEDDFGLVTTTSDSSESPAKQWRIRPLESIYRLRRPTLKVCECLEIRKALQDIVVALFTTSLGVVIMVRLPLGEIISETVSNWTQYVLPAHIYKVSSSAEPRCRHQRRRKDDWEAKMAGV